ncbi:TatD family hydrolase [Foetidibacter luteolus]|uniref:TatD family hydrolase n=1 Tax=Foetidibacter luteolus TaxID=2608880 RepID=UPI00129AD13B|nr:TatD family hydrolase [Foetidibacter luteolus]
MILVDTHCHLYLEEFKHNIADVVKRAENAGVQRFYLPAIDSQSVGDMLQLEKRWPEKFYCMIGLHPCYVKENYRQELEVMEDWLNKRPFVAIGEIGLDFYWDKTFTQQQYEAFNLQMGWALQRGMPIAIHTRNAMPETIDAVRPFAAKGLRGIFHCFSGTGAQAREITDMGFYLGIGGVVTYKNAGVAEALQNISLQHMVLETDAPYLTPVPFRGKRNESSYLPYIVARLAEVTGTTKEEVAAITTANAEKIFGN